MQEIRPRPSKSGAGKPLGWLSGLGVVVVPWIAAGIISTFTPEPESTFPWMLGAAFLAMLGWIAYGSVRIPGFRKGALIGSAVTLTLTAALYGALLWYQP